MEQDLITARNAQIQALADQLARTKTVFDLATELAAYIIKEKEKKPDVKISVTESELNALISMFKVKGIRADGQEERRGRPRRKDSPIIP